MNQTLGFVDFNYPARYTILITDISVERNEQGHQLKVQEQLYPDLDNYKIVNEAPFAGMEGWIALKKDTHHLVIYYKAAQANYMNKFMQQLELITEML